LQQKKRNFFVAINLIHKKRNKMTGVKEIREELGLTQPDFANYLAVTRGQLSMAESGRRFLPAAAMLKLAAITLELKSDGQAYLATEMQNQSEQEKRTLFAKAQEYNFLAMTANKKLEAMRNHHRQCLNTLRVSAGLLAKLPPGAASEMDKLCLEIMQREAVRKMRDCGMGQQAVLQLQADAFTYQAQQAEARAKTY